MATTTLIETYQLIALTESKVHTFNVTKSDPKDEMSMKKMSIVNNWVPPGKKLNGACFSGNGKVVATCTDDGTVTLSSTEGKSIVSFNQDESIQAVLFTNDSKHLITGGSSGIVSAWDCLMPPKQRHRFFGHTSPITSLVFSNDCSLIGSGSTSGNILVFPFENAFLSDKDDNFLPKKPVSLISSSSSPVNSLDFSRKAPSLMASSCKNGSIYIWDVEKQSLLLAFSERHTSECTNVLFSLARPELVMSIGLDKRLCFYDVKQKKYITQELLPKIPKTMAVHEDGKTIAIGTADSVMLFDLRNTKTPIDDINVGSEVRCVQFNNLWVFSSIFSNPFLAFFLKNPFFFNKKQRKRVAVNKISIIKPEIPVSPISADQKNGKREILKTNFVEKSTNNFINMSNNTSNNESLANLNQIASETTITKTPERKKTQEKREIIPILPPDSISPTVTHKKRESPIKEKENPEKSIINQTHLRNNSFSIPNNATESEESDEESPNPQPQQQFFAKATPKQSQNHAIDQSSANSSQIPSPDIEMTKKDLKNEAELTNNQEIDNDKIFKTPKQIPQNEKQKQITEETGSGEVEISEKSKILMERVVSEKVEGLKQSFHKDLRNLHMEMLKQFNVQQQETEQTVQRAFSQLLSEIRNLAEENSQLKNENQKLKELFEEKRSNDSS